MPWRGRATCGDPKATADDQPHSPQISVTPVALARWGRQDLATQAQADGPERRSNNSRSASVPSSRVLFRFCCMLEQFLWLKKNFQAGCYVFLSARLDYWKEPTLILYSGGEPNTRAHLVITPHAHVSESASGRNEFLTDFLMPKIELEQTPRTEMVRRPGLSTLPLSANPTAKKSPIICIAASPRQIEIVKTMAEIASKRVIGVYALDSQIQLVRQRKLS